MRIAVGGMIGHRGEDIDDAIFPSASNNEFESGWKARPAFQCMQKSSSAVGVLSVKSFTLIQRIDDNDREPARENVCARCQWLVDKVSKQHVDVSSAWANLICIQFFH
jgi:hypothetical protein